MIQPRRKSSKKRTGMPSEMIEQMEDILLNNFRDRLKRRVPEVAGYIFPEEIMLGVGLKSGKSLKQPRFDVSVDYNVNKDNVTKTVYACLDVLGSLMEKLVEEEDDGDFPRLWEPYEINGRKFYVQYSTNNLELESEADKLLGEASEGLLEFENEDDAFGDADTIKAQLGIDDEEDGSHVHGPDCDHGDDEEDGHGQKH